MIVNKSELVHVAWWLTGHRQTSTNAEQDVRWNMASPGHNELTKVLVTFGLNQTDPFRTHFTATILQTETFFIQEIIQEILPTTFNRDRCS